jgi:urease accessory protein
MSIFASLTVDGGSGIALDGLRSYVSALQLSDSAFPSGRYTLSHGLESVAHSGLLTGPDRPRRLLELVGDTIRYGVGPSDGAALACAHRAWTAGRVDVDRATRADERLTSVKLARESREASTRTGRAMLRTVMAGLAGPELAEFAARVDARRSPGNHAVIFGLVSASLGLPRLPAVASELYAYASGWMAAAVRLALIDHGTAQLLLHQTGRIINGAAVAASGSDIADIASCTPLVDVMAMRHEQADLRLFAS